MCIQTGKKTLQIVVRMLQNDYEMSQREIAQEMGIGYSTLKRYLSEGRSGLEPPKNIVKLAELINELW